VNLVGDGYIGLNDLEEAHHRGYKIIVLADNSVLILKTYEEEREFMCIMGLSVVPTVRELMEGV